MFVFRDDLVCVVMVVDFFFFLQLCFSYKEIFILKEEVITRLYKEKVGERAELS
jgi:hypothetical protein